MFSNFFSTYNTSSEEEERDVLSYNTGEKHNRDRVTNNFYPCISLAKDQRCDTNYHLHSIEEETGMEWLQTKASRFVYHFMVGNTSCQAHNLKIYPPKLIFY